MAWQQSPRLISPLVDIHRYCKTLTTSTLASSRVDILARRIGVAELNAANFGEEVQHDLSPHLVEEDGARTPPLDPHGQFSNLTLGISLSRSDCRVSRVTGCVCR